MSYNSLEPGTIFGEQDRYRIDASLASGAMGTVYRAWDVKRERDVALKVLFPHIVATLGGEERFRREIRASSTVKHPGVVELLDAGESKGLLYYTMELLDGEPMRDWLARRPPTLDALEVLLSATDALAAVHAAGIVHRDIKPDNIFVLRDQTQRSKLLDFGIARDAEALRATQTGTTVGTPLYMSPDQAIDPRTVGAPADVWSMGVILYEILTGQTPFMGETPQAVFIKTVQEPHTPVRELSPEVSPRLELLVDQCLAKNPIDRPENAAQMRDALRAILRAGDVFGSLDEQLNRASGTSMRVPQLAGGATWGTNPDGSPTRGLILGAVVATLVLGLLGGLGIWIVWDEEPAPIGATEAHAGLPASDEGADEEADEAPSDEDAPVAAPGGEPPDDEAPAPAAVANAPETTPAAPEDAPAPDRNAAGTARTRRGAAPGVARSAPASAAAAPARPPEEKQAPPTRDATPPKEIAVEEPRSAAAPPRAEVKPPASTPAQPAASKDEEDTSKATRRRARRRSKDFVTF